MAKDLELEAHRQWLGYIQPVGLVVSPVALSGAQAHLDRNVVADHVRFREFLDAQTASDEAAPDRIRDLPALLKEILGWEIADIAGAPGGPELPRSLDVSLPEFEETLTPTFAVPGETSGTWMMLVRVEAAGTDLDREFAAHDRAWKASPQLRFERLLRENKVAIGLLASDDRLRLVYAPPGESSGHLTFIWKELAETAGRPLFAALKLLLAPDRLWTLPANRRLPAILEASRKSQNLVSNELAEQVLDGLHELVRGFQAADAERQGQLLGDLPATEPDHVYGGLLSSVLRLVFLLYAEDRGLMPSTEVYTRYYSVNGLFEKLRDDAGRHPGLLDLRHGAWAQLLTLFRLVYDGSTHASLAVPRRHGKLFDPDAYPFLEGRTRHVRAVHGERLDPPRVSDGVVYRVLAKLMVLDGERLSYRTLDVEQIGSVYESLMGFRLERTAGISLAVKPDHVVVDLSALLEKKGAERIKALKELAGCELTGAAADTARTATRVEDLEAALVRKRSSRTPRLLAPGSLYLQPSEERRRSGSHYTPRTLTEPIVRTTLDPVIALFGERPTADQILELKVCDPAMGSGAFLVETCRYLGAKLVTAWQVHDTMPQIPPDEDPQLHAQRLVAQRCLYGVDRNPFAVDLAKLSLWLATLAREHPFTFLDHALRCGDSLVGLSRDQMMRLDWRDDAQVTVTAALVLGAAGEAGGLRAFLQKLGDTADDDGKIKLFNDAEKSVDRLRLVGDAVVSAFFSSEKPKEREARLGELQPLVVAALQTREVPARLAAAVRELRGGERPVIPFHWQVEFPEVFKEGQEGFDAMVGNPPFMGGGKITGSLGVTYLSWLQCVHLESHGNADLVSHFFRRAFSLIRSRGTVGLISTNTIAQGDTRSTGLRWICNHGGTVFAARRRVRWPGKAAVVVSVVHLAKHREITPAELDGRHVDRVTAFLFHAGGHDNPHQLAANAGRTFLGPKVYGQGFLFDDGDPGSTPLSELRQLIQRDPRNAARIFPYLGGEDINCAPSQARERHVINFGEMSEDEARAWPDLIRIVESKVRPERMKLADNPDGRKRKLTWWQWGRYTPGLFAALEGRESVLVIARISSAFAFTFVSAKNVLNEKIVVLPRCDLSDFCILQCRVHEVWARFFSTTLKDDLQYTPSDCFETFPFPGERQNSQLASAGGFYLDYRADLMKTKDIGLTTFSNRFHDPDERDAAILKLRELHDAMDRAVLDAYGWTDIQPKCQFLLDYEDEPEDDDTGRARTRKKPWRYRWPDDVRDEVLARLLDLNQKRAREEKLSGAAAEAASKSKRMPKKATTRTRRTK